MGHARRIVTCAILAAVPFAAGGATGAVAPSAIVASAALPTITQGDFDNNGRLDIRVVGTGAAERYFVSRTDLDAFVIGIDVDGDDVFDVQLVVNDGAPRDLIDINTGGGDDLVEIDMEPSSVGLSAIRIDLGSGNDLLEIDHDQNALDNSAFAYFVIGGTGNDVVDLRVDEMVHTQLTFEADMGVGNDVVLVEVTDGQSFFDFHVNASLGAGNDRFELNHSGNQVAPGACRIDVFVDAGQQDDEVKLQMRNELEQNTQFRFEAVLGDGNDTFATELEMHDFNFGFGADDQIRCEIVALGGLGDDVLRCNNAPFGDPTFGVPILDGKLEFRFDGGLGDDLLEIDLDESVFGGDNPASPIASFYALLDGGAGDDTLRFRAGTNNTFGGQFGGLLRGGLGDDNFDLFVDRAGAQPGTASQITIDGGLGVDTATVVANVFITKRL
jgi:hypothetical protein